MTPSEIVTGFIRGASVQDIVTAMIIANQTKHHPSVEELHENNRMLCMHQFDHKLGFERRLCVMRTSVDPDMYLIMHNPELLGTSEEDSAVTILEQSNTCRSFVMKSRRPVIDIRFAVGAGLKRVRTIIDDLHEASSFQMRVEEMLGVYKC
jgi:hypothetical protein